MTLATNRRRVPRHQTSRRRPLALVRNPRFVSTMADVVTLVIGLTTTATVHFIGDLPISEVILVVLLPIVLAIHGRRVLKPEFKVVFSLLGLWFIGQAISDVYRHSATIDWIRGDAAIIFFGLYLLGLIVLLRNNERRKVTFLAGTAIGSMLVTIIRPSQNALDHPWKFGYAVGVINLTLLISCLLCATQVHDCGSSHFGHRRCELAAEFSRSGWWPLGSDRTSLPRHTGTTGRMRILPRSGGALRVAVLVGACPGSRLGRRQECRPRHFRGTYQRRGEGEKRSPKNVRLTSVGRKTRDPGLTASREGESHRRLWILGARLQVCRDVVRYRSRARRPRPFRRGRT